jgi:hypothetical protein
MRLTSLLILGAVVLSSTKEYEENFKVTAEQPLNNEKDCPRTMEAIREFFGSVLGETGVPLAYDVHENVETPLQRR